MLNDLTAHNEIIPILQYAHVGVKEGIIQSYLKTSIVEHSGDHRTRASSEIEPFLGRRVVRDNQIHQWSHEIPISRIFHIVVVLTISIDFNLRAQQQVTIHGDSLAMGTVCISVGSHCLYRYRPIPTQRTTLSFSHA